ncbi:MAG: hypothetical protein F4X18_13105 [Acidimicrobiia bacterium]|nr:hypothetical protein [Acidimicrobiia bacterium]
MAIWVATTNRRSSESAHQAESREALANALLLIEKRFASQTKWIVGAILTMSATTIAVLR